MDLHRRASYRARRCGGARSSVCPRDPIQPGSLGSNGGSQTREQIIWSGDRGYEKNKISAGREWLQGRGAVSENGIREDLSEEEAFAPRAQPWEYQIQAPSSQEACSTHSTGARRLPHVRQAARGEVKVFNPLENSIFFSGEHLTLRSGWRWCFRSPRLPVGYGGSWIKT